MQMAFCGYFARPVGGIGGGSYVNASVVLLGFKCFTNQSEFVHVHR